MRNARLRVVRSRALLNHCLEYTRLRSWAGLRRRACFTDTRIHRRPRLIIVELSTLDRRDLRAFKLERIHLVVVEPDQAPLLTDPFQCRIWLKNMIFLALSLDDGDFVVSIISVRNRGRVSGPR
jgi:hypothetical protein